MKRSDPAHRLSFFEGAGGVAEMMRRHDWDTSPLGPAETWPQSLKTVIRIMLTSRYAMWMAWGPELTFFCNDAYLPTVGIKSGWVLGSRSDRVWEEIWPDIGPRIERVLRTGQATWDEGLLLFLERSGFPEETYHTFSYSPLSDDDGRIAGMLCVVTEVTERVIGERRLAALSQLGARLAAARSESEVVEAIAGGLAGATKDLPFSLLYLNGTSGEPRLERAIGFAPGHPAAPILLREGQPWQTAAGLVELGPSFGDLPSAPWSERPNFAVVVPIAPQGQPDSVGILIAGLNPHRPYDDAYSNFIDLLAGQIAAALAGARVYEEERRRAQALAAIDRAKTSFFSNVSHEFRTPLALLLGPLDDALAEEDALPKAQRERLVVAHRNALRLLKLVNSLLDFSRIEAGRIKAEFRRTDLPTFTAELASNFRSATEQAGLGLTIKCEALSGEAFVDRDMWEKIVLNLLSNAFKFTFEGGITVRLHDNADRSGVELVVSDTGVGIPEQEMPKLFERFHRVENQRGRSFEGSGIGLALVQELVRLHGGAIEAESKVGRGTLFRITIPFGAGHLASEQIESGGADTINSLRAEAIVQEAMQWLPDGADPLANVGTSSVPELGISSLPGRILVVDDNADMRSYIQSLLGRRWDVVTAEDGLAALDMIKKTPPDLVVTDAMMPRLDGFGLLRAIRDDVKLRDIPVIMLSARAGEEARVEGLEAGADFYLTKPFSARGLVAQVNASLTVTRIRHETTQRLEASAHQLARRTAQYETLLNRAPLGVYVVDSDFRIIEVNPTAMPFFGDIELIGRDFASVMRILWVARYAEEVIALFRHTLSTGEPTSRQNAVSGEPIVVPSSTTSGRSIAS
jgi:signal transduction histidine kinase/DNA-binding response OmpR family regulator